MQLSPLKLNKEKHVLKVTATNLHDFFNTCCINIFSFNFPPKIMILIAGDQGYSQTRRPAIQYNLQGAFDFISNVPLIV